MTLIHLFILVPCWMMKPSSNLVPCWLKIYLPCSERHWFCQQYLQHPTTHVSLVLQVYASHFKSSWLYQTVPWFPTSLDYQQCFHHNQLPGFHHSTCQGYYNDSSFQCICQEYCENRTKAPPTWKKIVSLLLLLLKVIQWLFDDYYMIIQQYAYQSLACYLDVVTRSIL